MTTNNSNDSVNHIPLLSEEMQRTLRRLAWKDETFREALFADPKAVIQQVFPHCFPDGKLPDDLTIKVIEEDSYTHHFVLPALTDEEPILEIAEEEQLELIVNLGELNNWKHHEVKLPNASTDKKQPDLTRDYYKIKQAEMLGGAKYINDSFPKNDAKFPTREELDTVLSKALQDKEIHQAAKNAHRTGGDFKNVIQMMQEKGYLAGFKLPEGVNIKVLHNTPTTAYLTLQSLPDASHNPQLSKKEQLEYLANINGENCKNNTKYLSKGDCSEGCQPRLTGRVPDCQDIF